MKFYSLIVFSLFQIALQKTQKEKPQIGINAIFFENVDFKGIDLYSLIYII